MTQTEYHIRFQKIRNPIENLNLTFVIGNMKCRTYAVVYFVLHAYNNRGDEIYSVGNKPIYTSKRWVVDESYRQYIEEFSVTDKQLKQFAFIQIELVAINVDDNNPLWFTQCMLTDDVFFAYHAPNEAKAESEVNLINNCYADMFITHSDSYLQIIRPSKKSFTTNKLTKNDITVIAPHLADEPQVDKSSNLLMEFLNQKEETTNIYIDDFIQ